MTPEQWAQATPRQQAEHVARFGPPPAHYPPPFAPTTLFPARKPSKVPRSAGWVGLGAGILVIIVIALTTIGRGDRAAPSSASTPTTTPTSCLTHSGGCSPTLPPAPDPLPTQLAPAVPVVPAPAVVAQPARTITARDWAKIAKDPDRHVGDSIVVYGEVTQFDAATGDGQFRANVDGVKHKLSYGYADYETNTFLTGNGADLGDLVEKDLFRAEVVVLGSVSYDTTLGGNITVPKLAVAKLVTIGTAK